MSDRIISLLHPRELGHISYYPSVCGRLPTIDQCHIGNGPSHISSHLINTPALEVDLSWFYELIPNKHSKLRMQQPSPFTVPQLLTNNTSSCDAGNTIRRPLMHQLPSRG